MPYDSITTIPESREQESREHCSCDDSHMYDSRMYDSRKYDSRMYDSRMYNSSTQDSQPAFPNISSPAVPGVVSMSPITMTLSSMIPACQSSTLGFFKILSPKIFKVSSSRFT